MVKEDSRKRYKDKNTGDIITYLDSNDLYEKHPTGDYHIVGETNIKKSDKKGWEIKEIDEKRKIYLYPLGTFDENNCTVFGYIPCGNNEYIKVYKTRLPKIIFPLLLAILLLLGLLTGYFLNLNDSGIDGNLKDYESSLKRPKNIGSTKILIPGYRTMEVKKGTDIGEIVLFNPEGNPCFFQFTLVEKSNGKVLFESKLVPPGKAVASVKLSKTFNKVGNRKVLLKFKTVDLEDKKINYNGSTVEMNLHVYE